MKKLIFTAVAVLMSLSTLSAEERVIEQNALPQNVQTFISAHYPTDRVSIATVERSLFEKDYKVILTSGVKIEFDNKGYWTEIDCKRNSEVPVAVVSTPIAQYIKGKFPAEKIKKIEQSRRFTEVELNNGIELTFNNKGNLVELDH